MKKRVKKDKKKLSQDEKLQLWSDRLLLTLSAILFLLAIAGVVWFQYNRV